MAEQSGESALLSVDPQSIVITNQGRPVFTIELDGTVVLGEGVTLDEAGRAFWEAIASVAPLPYRLRLNDGRITERTNGP